MFPLHTLFRVVGSWIYGADPLRFLRLGTHLGHLPRALANGNRICSRACCANG